MTIQEKYKEVNCLRNSHDFGDYNDDADAFELLNDLSNEGYTGNELFKLFTIECQHSGIKQASANKVHAWRKTWLMT